VERREHRLGLGYVAAAAEALELLAERDHLARSEDDRLSFETVSHAAQNVSIGASDRLVQGGEAARALLAVGQDNLGHDVEVEPQQAREGRFVEHRSIGHR
jgi:hypothetical protein